MFLLLPRVEADCALLESKTYGVLPVIGSELTVGPSKACVQVQVGLHVIAIEALALCVQPDSAARLAIEIVNIEVVAGVVVETGSGGYATEAEGGEDGGGRELHVDWIWMKIGEFSTMLC